MINKFASALIALLCVPALAAAEGHATPLVAGFEQEITVEPFNMDLVGRIAFTATIDGTDRILVLDLDTKRIRPLVDLPGNNSYPSWSPDGSKLAFTSTRDGRRAVYVSNWDGSSQRRLTKSAQGAEDHPSWAPDGTEVLYSFEHGTGDDGDSKIASASVATGTVKIVGDFKARNVNPRWRPDGEGFTYSTNRFWPGWDICTFTVKDQGERCALNGSQSYFRASWSNSGKQLAYSFGQAKYVDLGLLDAATAVTSTIAADAGKDYDPAWSPDDKLVLFAHENDGSEVFNLFLVDPKGNPPTPKKFLTSRISIRYPTWTRSRTIDLEARRILESEGFTPRPQPTPAPAKSSSSTSGTPSP